MLSCVQLFAVLWTAAGQASLSSTVPRSLLRFMPTESVMLSYHLIHCCPFSFCPQSFPASGSFPVSRLFGIRCTKYLSFSFSPSSEFSGLIFFRIDWLDLLAVHRTLKSLLQHHTLKASVLQCSAIFMVQLSHPYLSTGKAIALTRRTFVDKVMSLLNSFTEVLVKVMSQ